MILPFVAALLIASIAFIVSLRGQPALVDDVATVVLYEVEGSAERVAVTFPVLDDVVRVETRLPLVDQEDHRGVTVRVPDGDALEGVLIARNLRDDGTLTCRVSINGRVVSQETSTARYGTVQCSFSTLYH